MFAFATSLFILIAVTNLLGLLLGKTPSVRQLTIEMIETEGGLGKLRGALTVAWLAQIYLVALVFPLKAIDYHLGLAWAILMLLTAVETVHTSRKMLQTVAAGDRAATFPIHDSPAYAFYQVLYNVATIGVCVFLLMPR